MLIKKPADIRYSEITPKSIFLNRRAFLTGVPAAFLAGPLAAQAYRSKLPNVQKSPLSTTETPNTYEQATTYNNYYEFGTSKSSPAKEARNFVTSPWTVSVEGEVEKKRSFSLDEIRALAPLEERIYRFRCVEAWSMVIPWVGYSLSTILNQVKPTAKAKYVAFQSYHNIKQMPLATPDQAGINLPYVEGLRLDEAMHRLTMLTVGMYGENLAPQNGAPVRIIVPWKYGFKSIKSIVKITLTEKMPPTTWNITNAGEYGFYSNVNPKVDHPRWSQARERRLPSLFANTATRMFNGYDEVASLYTGMDLKKNY